MRDVYTAKLSRLSDEVLEMGNLCGQAIMKTCQLLASVEVREAATKEIGRIEKEIDDKEHNIEALCMQLLLLFQKTTKGFTKGSSKESEIIHSLFLCPFQFCNQWLRNFIPPGQIGTPQDKFGQPLPPVQI